MLTVCRILLHHPKSTSECMYLLVCLCVYICVYVCDCICV